MKRRGSVTAKLLTARELSAIYRQHTEEKSSPDHGETHAWIEAHAPGYDMLDLIRAEMLVRRADFSEEWAAKADLPWNTGD